MVGNDPPEKPVVKREKSRKMKGVLNMKQEKIVNALDVLAVALTEENHIWTPEERGFYEDAIRQLENRKKILRK